MSNTSLLTIKRVLELSHELITELKPLTRALKMLSWQAHSLLHDQPQACLRWFRAYTQRRRSKYSIQIYEFQFPTHSLTKEKCTHCITRDSKSNAVNRYTTNFRDLQIAGNCVVLKDSIHQADSKNSRENIFIFWSSYNSSHANWSASIKKKDNRKHKNSACDP